MAGNSNGEKTMKTLINLTGPIAVGKTTMMNLLRKELKDYIFVDRAHMKDMLKPLEKKYRKKIADESALYVTKELMKRKKNILIYEQNTSDLKRKLRNFSKGYKIYGFFLKCNVELAIKRDMKREKKSGDPEAIKEMHARVKPSKQDVIIDTEKLTKKETLKIILKSILP